MNLRLWFEIDIFYRKRIKNKKWTNIFGGQIFCSQYFSIFL